MKSIYKVLGLATMVGLASCNLDDTLYDRVPAEKFPENAGQLEAMTEAAYGEGRYLLDDGGFWFYAQEVSADVLVFPQRGTDWEDGGKWRVLNRHTWTATSLPVENMWKTIYTAITRCNQTIETIQLAEQNESTEAIIAELEVLRSFHYYLLIDNYGAVPYVDSFANAEADPYRNNRSDIANKLIEVVEEALPLLQSNREESYKVSQEMAWMLLSKLYLNMGVYDGSGTFDAADMDKVVEYTNNVIASGHSLESNRLAPFYASNEFSSENIFTILNDENASDGMRLVYRTLHTLNQSTFDMKASPWNGCTIKPDFYQNYFAANDGFVDADDVTSANDEKVDVRSRAFARGQQYALDGSELENDNGKLIFTRELAGDVMDDKADGGAETRFSGYRVLKYEVGSNADYIMNNDFPVFRLADAYLMRSEASTRGGSGATATADDDLNKIRNAAGLGNTSATLDEILAERAREMFLEGHRRSDLIRFGEFEDRDWWLGADASDAGTHRLVFPLPQSEVNATENLVKDPVALN